MGAIVWPLETPVSLEGTFMIHNVEEEVYITKIGDFLISIRGDSEKIRVIEIALNYLPQDIVDDLQGTLAILTMTHRWGIKLSTQLCQKYEIVLIGEGTFPKVGRLPHRDDFRHFIFIVLHEIAHAYLKHKCPYFDESTKDEIDANEDEATRNAIDWFNFSVKEKGINDQKDLTLDEIKLFQLENDPT